jgi:hypothetical protein
MIEVPPFSLLKTEKDLISECCGFQLFRKLDNGQRLQTSDSLCFTLSTETFRFYVFCTLPNILHVIKLRWIRKARRIASVGMLDQYS